MNTIKSKPRSAPIDKIDRPASWGGVLALSLGAFVLVASEFMPVSLLTPIAADLHISEGMAGQAISASGAFAVLTSLFISSFAGRLDRKVLLLCLTFLMIVSGTVAAFAPNFTIFIIGRAFLGVAIGGFWSISAATTMRLVPESQVPQALAILNSGNALATVIAAPLGSFLGSIIGWRDAFFCLVPIAALALGWKIIGLPKLAVSSEYRPVHTLSLLKRPAVVWGMAAISTFFLGQFTLYTYLRPFLETITRVGASSLSVMLLIIGISGFIGTIFIGRFVDKDVNKPLIVIPLIMASIALLLVALGWSWAVTAVLLSIWGLFGTAAPVAWWTWLARTLPQDAEAGGGLLVAVVQIAISSGALIGGMLYDFGGYRATFGASAFFLVVACALAAISARSSSTTDVSRSRVGQVEPAS